MATAQPTPTPTGVQGLKPPEKLNHLNAEEYKRWKQRFEIYIIASGASTQSDQVKIALLLHCMGEESLEIFNTLGLSAENKKNYEAVVEKFDEYFIPKKNESVASHIFFTRQQKQGESFDSYLTELKKLSQDCDFGTLQERLIRDRIVAGICDNKLKDRLLRESDLDLRKAIQICKAAELATERMKEMEDKHAVVDKVRMEKKNDMRKLENRKQAGTESRMPRKTEESTSRPYGSTSGYTKKIEYQDCSRCGFKHDRRNCPAYGKICVKCKKPGHYARMCRAGFMKIVKTIQEEQKQDKESSEEEEEVWLGSVTTADKGNTSLMAYRMVKITEPLVLGEGPHWDESVQALYFVDIPGCSIHKYDPATKQHSQTKLDGSPSFIIPLKDETDKFIVGLEKKFVVVQWDGADGSPVSVREITEEVTSSKINDGKCDPRGRLFAGTLGEQTSPWNFTIPTGRLFRLDGTKPVPIADQLLLSNGLAWDLQREAFYFIDSNEHNIRRYDYDVATGDISNMTHIFDFKKNNVKGTPDGMTIDTDGNLWVACVNGSSVIKVDPATGKLLQTIPIPAKQVTSVTFGGPDLDELYVTTGRLNIDGEHPPPCGATFVVTGLGVRGHPNVNLTLKP